MATNMTMTNESFDFLKGSTEFLNIVLNNITGCVLLLDKDLNLRAFNDALKTIFSNKRDEDLLYRKCGEAIGCAYQIEEQIDCGKTSKCSTCELKAAALLSYLENKPVFKEFISKPFFDSNNLKIEKHLQFSTRVFMFKQEKYVIMIIDDITRFREIEMQNYLS